MNRLLLGLALLTAACGGHKSFDSLCADQVPPPAACNTACDPSSGTGDATCPSGFHCAAAGKCDTLCTPTGNECGNGYSCTTDGFCQSAGDGDDQSPIDANCPAIHFTPMKTTPTVQLLLDQSGSMTSNYGNNGTSKPDRWDALRTALVDPTAGVVATLGDKVVFGATLYSAHSTDQPNVCPILTKTTDRKLNNFTEIQQLVNSNNPLNDTPTAASIDAVRMDFAANPPAQGSPPIIVLATDGLPDTCDVPNPANQTQQDAANAVTVKAAQDAYTAGIKLFFLFVGDAGQAGTHPQQMANAGTGMDPATGTAMFYTAKNPAELTAAFNTIVGGVLSCDLKLTGGTVDPGSAQTSGVVTLNGMTLAYGTDWTVDNDGVTLHLLGAACTTLKTTTNPTVDAAFSCGSVIF
ncbi:MAG TPA: vWA domain-containing protein [Kofleriaceae bacterium]|nr:vWA domain-containing protein [Kofleriaceae bacterium]